MRITARTLLFMLTLPLVGCSIVGQSESSCPGKPNGYVCKGPREVYEITNSKTSLFDGSQDGLDDDEKKPVAAGDKADDSGAVVDVPAVGVVPSNSLSLSRDDFSAPKRWLVGAAANKQPAKIIPLQMRQDADGNLGHKAKVNNTVDPLGVKKISNTPGVVAVPSELLKK